jgi:ABC-type antimicrobial peptide transport system permease subunit
MFKKKNSKYHSILQSIKKQPVKSNLATRHEEITNDLESNKLKISSLNAELSKLEKTLESTTNISDKNQITLKSSALKSQIQQLSLYDEFDYYHDVVDILMDYEDDTQDKFNLLNNFLSKVDKETVTSGNKKKNKFDNMSRYCPSCKDEMILDLHNGLMVCQMCGESQTILVESDIPNYKEDSNDTKTYVAYKTMNHFNEWLNKIQGKEVIELSDEVCDKIKKEISKYNLKGDIKNISPQIMREILSKLALNKYYDDIPYIIFKTTGKEPPQLSREQEEKLRQMFREVQEPFKMYKPNMRKNLISYSYIIYKLCELIELDHILPFIHLLKSDQKIKDMDINIWKKICTHLNWEFIPSI